VDNVDQTIASIYGAAAGECAWGDPLTRIVRDLGALGSQMLGINLTNGAIAFSHASDWVEGELELEYVRKYHTTDPRIPLLINRPVGDWLYDQDAFPKTTFEIEPYWRDYLSAIEGKHSATIRLYADEKEAVLFAAVMRRESPGFGEEPRRYLARLSPHFSKALAIHRRTRGLAKGNAAGAQLIGRIRKPVLVMDPSRTIALANSLGRKLLDERTVLADRDGHLAAFDPRDESALTESVIELMHTLGGGEPGARRIVRLHGGDERRFAVSLIVFDPPTSMHAFGSLPQIMLTLHGAPTMPEPDQYLWQAAFDLTPAEARVGAQIFGGASVRAAAKALGVSFNTANSQLDVVFAKTGTRRQADLVKVLLLAMD
jgi:DNA-binding CsgD family transcriptional regulator